MPELSNNKRIAKNTLLLYLRMFYTLLISLFTARVVLNSLGFDDYGIYNVVGSVVSMFVFLRSALGNATNRFITFALGKGDEERLNIVFSTSVVVHFVLGIIIVVLAETVGLWFLQQKMVIPEERMAAAQWCYQFSVLTCFLSVICVPYDAEIIAHEKMGVFAFVQVFNTTMNLGIAYLISHTSTDRLILYGLLLLIIQILNRVFYGLYCGRKFKECHFKWTKDKALIKEMTSFAGWSMLGNLAAVGFNQGLNILLNVFFGPVVNAARGVAVQVQGVVQGFITNFQIAVNPQITKSYAAKDLQRMRSLVILSSKFSYFLMLLLCLPVFFEAPKLLQLWLGNVPDHTVNFIRILIFIMLVSTMENSIAVSKQAAGNIRNYQIIVGSLLLTILPISYIALRLGAPVESVFIVHLVVAMVSQIVRVLLVRKDIGLPLREYLNVVVLRVALVTAISCIIPFVLYKFCPDTIWMMILVILCCVASVAVSVMLFGVNTTERQFILKYVRGFFDHLWPKKQKQVVE